MNHRTASEASWLMGVTIHDRKIRRVLGGEVACRGENNHRERKSIGLVFALALVVSLGVASAPVFANPDVVVVDRFNIEHNVTAIATTTPQLAQIEDPSSDNVNIIGGWRKVRHVQFASGVVSGTVVNATDRTASHDNFSGTRSTNVLTWDGTNDQDGLQFELEANFDFQCPQDGAERGFSFVTDVQANSATLTFEVYTDASNFSAYTFQITQTPPTELVVIPFSLLDSGGPGVTVTGTLDWADINAIRLTSVADVNAVDFQLLSPIVASCGLDFGDAPQAGAAPAGENHTGFNYPVTLGIGGSGGAGLHFIGGPFLGLGTNDTDAEPDGQPTLAADGDDVAGTNDEQAVVGGFPSRPITSGTLPGFTPEGPLTCDGVAMTSIVGEFSTVNANDLYCVTLEVSNPTGRPANVVGWIDFDGSGNWGNSGCGTSANGLVTGTCERSSAQVFIGSVWGSTGTATCNVTAPGDEDPPVGMGGSSWDTGNVPANCEGHVVLVWDLSNFRNQQDHFTVNATYARFRISTDTDTFLTASGATPCCTAVDGEVEDHKIDPGLLPVTVSSFESRWTGQGLEVSWATSSESENVGFYIWGFDGEELHLLTPEMIRSRAVDLVEPQQYSVLITDRRARSMESLAVAAVDIFGQEAIYGLYQTGSAFGREAEFDSIDWASIRQEVAQTLTMHESLGSRASEQAPVVAADFRVRQTGMHRISYEQLVEAGMNFAGVNPAHLAVTRAGEAVPRFIRAQSAVDGSRASAASNIQFGPGSYIEFWGEKPGFPDAIYVQEYIYRVSIEPRKAVTGRLLAQRVMAGNPLPYYLGSFTVNDDNFYAMGSPLADPWIAARLDTFNDAGRTYQTEVVTGPQFAPGAAGRLEVAVAGFVAHSVSPAHHVRVYFNDVPVYDALFGARQRYDIAAEIPAHLIVSGANQVRVTLPGGTSAPFDIVDVDTVTLFYPRAFSLIDGAVLIEEAQARSRVQVPDAPSGDLSSVFAWDGQYLRELRSHERTGAGLIFQTLENPAMQYWVSTQQAMLTPESVGGVPAMDLLAEPADFLVIAHPAFIPISEFDTHPLNEFVNLRRGEGWTVRVVDVTDIQLQFGGGMPLPWAVTDFLRAAATVFAPTHVLLVGGDSADYHDRRGLGSLSFIPTIYAPTGRTPHTPSDGLLADLTGDGIADLAIGRWPVRTIGDLSSIVTKTRDWSASVSDLRSAVWVADSNDARHPSFTGKAGRMLGQLDDAGWGSLSYISLDSMSPSVARRQLFDAIEAGATFTGFVGHGTPTSWTFQNLLRSNDVRQLHNEGNPTLISASSCMATYFVSPSLNTVSHRLMNGFRVDSNNQPIAGAANGAVAIHGASVNAALGQNEFMVSQVKAGLLQGESLGEAVRLAREAAAERGMRDQVVNWVLLGDPTLRLNRDLQAASARN